MILAKAFYDKIWMIDFFLRNLVDYQILSTNPDSQPDLMLDIVENEVYVIYAVQASITTKCPMDFSSYPFDRCEIFGFFSSRSLKRREKYITFAQFVYFLREVCLLFNFFKFTIMSKKT